jgi:tetratricopeptide (TPR) repeat protein
MQRRSVKSLLLTCFTLCLTGAQLHSSAPISNNSYLEPGACASCHQAIAESYARTAMARTFGAVRSASEFPELKRGNYEHSASEEFFNVFTREGKPYLKRHQIGFDGKVTNVLEARMDYWFGSGNHARSYISRTKAGELIELPLTWYAENGGYWAMSPGYARPDHAGFSRKLSYRCMSCHNGALPIQADAGDGGTHFPASLLEGIDCQRCHGPGQAHVDAARQGFQAERVRSAILNPARLSAERQMEVCMQCHLETTSLKLPATLLRFDRGVFSYRAGEPLENYILHFDRAQGGKSDDRFEFGGAAYQLRKSACYLKSNGALTCTTCHNPHEPSNTPAAHTRYTVACQNCHQPAVQKLVAARRHTDSQACASCHMPKRRPSDAIHTQVTDHFIQRRPATEPATARVEKHDGNTPPYRGSVELYYPEKLARTPENELYLALAQVKHDANLDQGLRELEAAIALHAPKQAEFYFELAEGYRRAGNSPKAISFYEQASRRAPANWRYFLRLGTALTTAEQPERAAQALERSRVLAPQESAVLEAIANLLARQGKLQEAVATLQASLALDPESANPPSLLGARLFQQNDLTGAEKAWREAVRLRPEAATMRLNLANLLASSGRFREAQSHFHAALRSAPSFADAHLAYALALDAHGQADQAELHLRKAIDLAPNCFEAHLKLGQMLHARGDAARAAPHLRKAAESPNARIRDTANQLLTAK